jgi:hypothetical protein
MLFFLVWRRERGSSAPLDRDLGNRGPLILKIPALWAQKRRPNSIILSAAGAGSDEHDWQGLARTRRSV